MNRLFPPFLAGPGAGGLLLLRIVAGSAFVMHGLPKIRNPFNWMPAEADVPGVFQAAAAVAEFGGGLCWILGFLTPIFSMLIMCTMVTAITTYHLPKEHPFVSAPGSPSYEQALLYLCIAVAFLVLGPGSISLDALFFGRNRRPPAAAPEPTQVIEEGQKP
jgi:putative oxidoreductase